MQRLYKRGRAILQICTITKIHRSAPSAVSRGLLHVKSRKQVGGHSLCVDKEEERGKEMGEAQIYFCVSFSDRG